MRKVVALLLGLLLAACTAQPPPPQSLPPIGIDPLGIAPTGGAIYTTLKDRAVFDQHDGRWDADQLGESGETIGEIGCTLTSVAMAAVNLGEAADPGTLNRYLSAHQGYTARGLLIWNGVSRASEGRVVAEYFDAPSHGDIDACLTTQNGYPIVQFMLRGRVPHWVVIVGKRETSWLIRDPLFVTQAPVALETRAPSIRAVRCIRPARQ